MKLFVFLFSCVTFNMTLWSQEIKYHYLDTKADDASIGRNTTITDHNSLYTALSLGDSSTIKGQHFKNVYLNESGYEERNEIITRIDSAGNLSWVRPIIDEDYLDSVYYGGGSIENMLMTISEDTLIIELTVYFTSRKISLLGNQIKNPQNGNGYIPFYHFIFYVNKFTGASIKYKRLDDHIDFPNYFSDTVINFYKEIRTYCHQNTIFSIINVALSSNNSNTYLCELVNNKYRVLFDIYDHKIKDEARIVFVKNKIFFFDVLEKGRWAGRDTAKYYFENKWHYYSSPYYDTSVFLIIGHKQNGHATLVEYDIQKSAIQHVSYFTGENNGVNNTNLLMKNNFIYLFIEYNTHGGIRNSGHSIFYNKQLLTKYGPVIIKFDTNSNIVKYIEGNKYFTLRPGSGGVGYNNISLGKEAFFSSNEELIAFDFNCSPAGEDWNGYADCHIFDLDLNHKSTITGFDISNTRFTCWENNSGAFEFGDFFVCYSNNASYPNEPMILPDYYIVNRRTLKPVKYSDLPVNFPLDSTNISVFKTIGDIVFIKGTFKNKIQFPKSKYLPQKGYGIFWAVTNFCEMTRKMEIVKNNDTLIVNKNIGFTKWYRDGNLESESLSYYSNQPGWVFGQVTDSISKCEFIIDSIAYCPELFIIKIQDTLWTSYANQGISFKWYIDGGVSDDTLPFLDLNKYFGIVSSVRVEVKTKYTCSGISDNFNIEFDGTKHHEFINFSIFPNPTEYGTVTFTASNKINRILIYNMQGIKVADIQGDKQTVIINTGTWSNGLYTCCTTINGLNYVSKLVVSNY